MFLSPDSWGVLLRGAQERRIAGTCGELYDPRDWLWNVVEVGGVEPTKNATERALRHAVTWRKLSFDAQSAIASN